MAATMSEVSERVSVVVPTRNNERTIAACLASVRAQDYADVELIVVDNHSTDATQRIAQEYADRLEVAGPERSAQRNAGIEVASGPWVIWLDSDMILPPGAVSAAVATAHETGAQGVALPERTVGQGFWTACRALERECYLDQPGLHNPRLLRRDYLQHDGGFDPAMSGPEDADLRLRMRQRGDQIALAPVIIDHDEGRLTLGDIWTKRYYYGLSIPALEDEHDGAVSGQGRALLRAYVDNRGRLLRHPVHAAGMVLMRAMEAAGYLAGARASRRRR